MKLLRFGDLPVPKGTGERKFHEKTAQETAAALERKKLAQEKVRQLHELRIKQNLLDKERHGLYQERQRMVAELEADWGRNFEKVLGIEPEEKEKDKGHE